MLCKKIIVANDNIGYEQKLIDFIKNSNVFFENEIKEKFFVLNISANDESLYEICCEISEYIKHTAIKEDVKKILEREFSCFNADEKSRICKSVFAAEELKELSGRIYVYLKFNKSVNPVGFYRFMCKDVAHCVENAVLREAEKMISINDTEEFIGMLRYFSAMSPVSTDIVELTADKNGLRISAVKGNGDCNTEFADLEIVTEDILAELVTLNPSSIVVHGKEYFECDGMSSVILGVFGDRISYCT